MRRVLEAAGYGVTILGPIPAGHPGEPEVTEYQEAGMSTVDSSVERAGPSSQNVHVPASEAQVSDFLGTRNRVLLTAAQTGGTAGVVDISVEPGAGAPSHTNTREALIWFVIDGALSFQTERGPVQVAKHGSLFLPRGSTHTFANRSDMPARALMVCVPGGFEEYLRIMGEVLPNEAPAGPPPAEAMKSMVELALQFGVEIHPDAPA